MIRPENFTHVTVLAHDVTARLEDFNERKPGYFPETVVVSTPIIAVVCNVPNIIIINRNILDVS